MASTSAGPSGEALTDPKRLAAALYEECRSTFPPDHVFYQQDLVSLGVVPNNDIPLLMKCAQSLVDQSLFRMLQGKDERLAWRLIAQEDAAKLKNLNADERLIYNVIHSTGRTGVWTKTIKARTNLHQTIVNRCLKSLETKNYIKSLRNVKFPNRKMYMLAGLQPSEDVTGGAWFTDGVLDADFIRGLGGWIEHWVSARSWHDVAAADKHKNKRQKSQPKPKSSQRYLPYPASHSSFPTVGDITNAVNHSGLTPVTMGEASIGELLQMLCYDGKLVSLREGSAYKSIKKPNQISLQRELGLEGENAGPGDPDDPEGIGRNGMTEVPCGRCPVFNLCEDGGPVNPENCEYFDEWMKKSLDF